MAEVVLRNVKKIYRSKRKRKKDEVIREHASTGVNVTNEVVSAKKIK